MSNMYTANQDIRDYMADHGVTQKMLGQHLGKSAYSINTMLKNELAQKQKEDLLHHIDAIVADRMEGDTEATEDAEQTNDVSVSTKFQIGDRVKIPSKSNKIGTVSDIWSSLAKAMIMYAVNNEEDGHCGMYAEDQLEPAPLPIEYTFNTTCDNNVAVVCMIAHQGDKTWVHVRGHAHILHDGAVGMAQAVSYAAKRMFEFLDTKSENRIYFK